MARVADVLPGSRFGLWTVEGNGDWQVQKSGRRQRTIRCCCDCGTMRDLQPSNLIRGSTLSCGCNSKPRLSEAATKHGLSRHPLYQTLRHMKSRCFKVGSHAYDRYGARGITVCEEWCGVDGAKKFYDWSMENGYRKGLTIDRLDNDGGYSPENCRWATYRENLNNRRNTIYVDHDGRRMPLGDYYDLYGDGISYRAFYERYRRGVPLKEAIQV